MRKLFYIGVVGLILFEVANVYFIMPMPGSQRMNSIDFAYFLYTYRWLFRIVFIILMAFGVTAAFAERGKWFASPLLIVAVAVAYMFNFKMSADHMFLQAEHLIFKSKDGNTLPDSSVVVSVANNGQVKAYPMRFIIYHHQVQDTVGGTPVIATYCSVCRTGRVFEPTVKGKHEKFRLVGMDHFNAMFEDETTKSWWRQATGEAITGSLKGEVLPELTSSQMTVRQLFALYPNAQVMQMDNTFRESYDSIGKYERGKSTGDLTRPDTLPWKDKSWVVGVDLGGKAKAYDWIDLKNKRVINDEIDSKPIAIVVADDNQSFIAFERPGSGAITVRHDSLFAEGGAYDLAGKSFAGSPPLKQVNAYQEFWHSWRTFHPGTERFTK